ncbi:MAG: hypothetical protein R3256_06620 [Thalassovita sp.]|nr:hypothetical protein [Thalassovita sp.]
MTNNEIRAAQLRPILILEELIARHGGWNILRAFICANVHLRRHRRPSTDQLSNHMRRDIGLPPKAPPPGRIR